MAAVEDSASSAELRELNRLTFLAEERRSVGEKNWRQFLVECLDEDFVIRRARADLPNQNREQMLDWIEKSSIIGRTIKDAETVVWCGDQFGVVRCPIEMLKDGALHRYVNVKVFRRNSGTAWQCVYWQVTESPLAPGPG